MGALAAGSQIAASTVSTAGSILSGTTPLWTTATWAVPVIGAAVTAVTLVLTAIFNRKGNKQKTATTKIADEVQKAAEDNLKAYMAGPRTVSSQAQALANADAAYAYLIGADGCGNSEMGKPGLRCIFERQAVGTCTQAQADAAGESLSDCGKYSFARDLRDPIANDASVVADPVTDTVGNLVDSVTGEVSQLVSSAVGGSTGWLLLAGLAIAAAFAFGGGGHK
jgi:hypothetical protein